MFESLKFSFRLRMAYRTNSIIHAVKCFPIIKKILPDSLYSCEGLKAFVHVISIIYEIISAFAFKFCYIALMILLPFMMMDCNDGNVFIHIFFFLTVIGAFVNTVLFQPTKDKYYAIFSLRMDAKKFTLSNYFYTITKSAAATLPAVLVLGLITHANLFALFLMPIFLASIKISFTAFLLKISYFDPEKQKGKLPSVIVFSLAAALLACAYAGAYFKVILTLPLFIALTLISLISVYFAFKYLFSYNGYRYVYKQLFSSTGNPINHENAGQIIQTSMLKKIDTKEKVTSKKSGCAYLNDIFVKRHRKLLTISAQRFAAVLGLLFLIAFAVTFIYPKFNGMINQKILTSFPIFLFIMYFVNRGTVITKSMFMNCDHSLLAYRFYRQPKIILSLFTARLKSIILINFIPASVISLGLPILLYLSGGTKDSINYVLLFVTVIAMSVFFSIHNLVMYYLLQPYNESFETKSFFYTAIQGATYYICYAALNFKFSILIFGSAVSAFCVIYAVIALILAYRLAPKTFKLRQ